MRLLKVLKCKKKRLKTFIHACPFDSNIYLTNRVYSVSIYQKCIL